MVRSPTFSNTLLLSNHTGCKDSPPPVLLASFFCASDLLRPGNPPSDHRLYSFSRKQPAINSFVVTTSKALVTTSEALVTSRTRTLSKYKQPFFPLKSGEETVSSCVVWTAGGSATVGWHSQPRRRQVATLSKRPNYRKTDAVPASLPRMIARFNGSPLSFQGLLGSRQATRCLSKDFVKMQMAVWNSVH